MLLGVFCAAFALVAPRFKHYTYMLLLVPTWNILMASTCRTLTALAISLVLLSSNYIRDLVIYVTGVDFGYWSLLAVASIWVLYLVELLHDRALEPRSLRVRELKYTSWRARRLVLPTTGVTLNHLDLFV